MTISLMEMLVSLQNRNLKVSFSFDPFATSAACPASSAPFWLVLPVILHVLSSVTIEIAELCSWQVEQGLPDELIVETEPQSQQR